MSRADHIRLMAAYNAWMNTRLYEAAGRLPAEALAADRKAFFGSILGTLNHLLVADRIWLARFAAHPARHAALDPVRALPVPQHLDQRLFADLQSLAEHRRWLDGVISAWAGALVEADLDHPLHYANRKGATADRNFFSLVMHFFNHQTHHRGQVTTLLSQAGCDAGVTDLLALIPDESGA
ncbi:MAG: DinB family protein [Porticoccaceae bacterium]